MTRDEFLVRDFLDQLALSHSTSLAPTASRRMMLPPTSARSPRRAASRGPAYWTQATTERVASGLLRIAADFGILTGGVYKEFAPYHLPDESFVYLLHAMKAAEHNARRVIDSPDWRMYLLDSADVEREVFRLHQFHRVSLRGGRHARDPRSSCRLADRLRPGACGVTDDWLDALDAEARADTQGERSASADQRLPRHAVRDLSLPAGGRVRGPQAARLCSGRGLNNQASASRSFRLRSA